MAAYASIADLTARHDQNLIAELITDTHESATASEVSASTILTAVLTDASGQVEAAMLCGDRYSPAELAALTGNSLGLLKKIVCTIAMESLLARRPGMHMEKEKYYAEKAKSYLEDLRTGKNLFNLTDDTGNRDAANPDTTAPTSVDYTTLNLLPEQMIRHFPNRWARLPTDRS
jgi:phage gp36-like protein